MSQTNAGLEYKPNDDKCDTYDGQDQVLSQVYESLFSLHCKTGLKTGSILAVEPAIIDVEEFGATAIR